MSFTESQPPVPPTLEELDSNFQVETSEPGTEDGLVWTDARQLTVEGLGWPSESSAYCRLPDRAEGVVRPEVWALSRHSAGVCVRFISDAPVLEARWKLSSAELALPHMPATGVSGLDLYARDPEQNGKWRWASSGRAQAQENQALLLENELGGEWEYCLYLPLYNGTVQLELGVPRSATLKPAPRRTVKPIVCYGTSIVQGGCASRTGMAYPAILGRRLDLPCLNLGFSGNGRSEPEVADLLAELDPCVYVLDPLPNMGAADVLERIGPFVKTLRAAHAETPIVLVENITYQNGWINRARRERAASSNEALRQVWAALERDGISNLHYVPGEEFLGGDGEATVDGVHPTDVGFLRQAEMLEAVVRGLVG